MERERNGLPKATDADLVFASELGTPIDPSNLLANTYYPLLLRAGLPRLTFNAGTRHTAATLHRRDAMSRSDLLAVTVGLVVFLALAQFIDGRIGFFIGLGVAFTINVWQHGQRSFTDYVAIPFAVAFALGAFFLLVGVNGWLALLVGAFVALSTANSYNAARRSRREYLEKLLTNPDS